MSGHVAALFRHPVKGFTPEQLNQAALTPGQGFAYDRVYAVENGPSGFDAANPAWITKQKFTVLAAMARVACARTKFDDATGILYASASGQREFAGSLRTGEGRAAFAQWLGQMLGEEAKGPLRVLESPDFRFMDHPLGHVSIINMASVRDLEARIGAPVDPLRFRGNVYVEGWEPWIENSWEARDLMLGFARATVFKPIVRCIATHVDPTTGEKDLDIVKALFDAYGHMNCGIYIHVTHGGGLSVGDAVTAPEPLS